MNQTKLKIADSGCSTLIEVFLVINSHNLICITIVVLFFFLPTNNFHFMSKRKKRAFNNTNKH